jgi:hypothetical protein
MAVLTFCCPQTGHDVQSAIDTSGDMLRRMNSIQLSLWCPHCLISHQVMAKNAWVLGDLPVGR